MSFDSKSGVLKRMRTQCADILQSMSTAWRPPPGPQVTPGRSEGALEALAADLLNEGIGMWLADSGRIVEAIVKIEQSWALRQLPETAIQLGVMYDLVNRHGDALAIYRQAVHRFPDHPRLRHEAGITLLRHGQPRDIKDFFHSVLRIDPTDLFAKLVMEMLDKYPCWVSSLASAIKVRHDGKTVYTLACSIWGDSFASDFIRYLCAVLLAPKNLPALALCHPVVFAIFTTAEIERRLRADPQFQKLATYAAVQFIHYDAHLVDYREQMQRHYGDALGPYYSRTCKFLLFSCAHYAALAAAHDLDSVVVSLCADTILSDGVLTGIADLMTKDVDIVSFWGYRLHGKESREIVDSFRRADGSLSVPANAVARLFIDHAPDAYLVDSKNFTSVPENLCWRVGNDALLVHASHYHPIGIRPSALKLPLELTIDPIDSRFLDKQSFDPNRHHFIRDLSLASINLEDGEEDGGSPRESRTMSVRDVGRWLWQVWAPWRERNLKAPILISPGPPSPETEAVRSEAQATVDAIIQTVSALEEGNRPRKTWCVRPSAD